MFNFWTVLYLLIVGTIMGYLARLLVPGRDAMNWWQTILLGVVGSFIGGFAGYLLFGFDEGEGAIQPGGIFGSLFGSIVLVLLVRFVRDRQTKTTP
jgi:uncharacterized membrane protein YeaQ/YmgE (transglycosylase-associated protein family)